MTALLAKLITAIVEGIINPLVAAWQSKQRGRYEERSESQAEILDKRAKMDAAVRDKLNDPDERERLHRKSLRK